jgi:NAD-dependent SIR2 family protein deacetylase
LEKPPLLLDGTKAKVEADSDGAWSPASNAGVLKPAVVMFGELVGLEVRRAAEEAIDDAGRLLVAGSSLATFSAWRLVERALNRGMTIGILNVGGVRNETRLFDGSERLAGSLTKVRCSEKAELVLPEVASKLEAVR